VIIEIVDSYQSILDEAKSKAKALKAKISLELQRRKEQMIV